MAKAISFDVYIAGPLDLESRRTTGSTILVP
jgi:hypothetical protein